MLNAKKLKSGKTLLGQAGSIKDQSRKHDKSQENLRVFVINKFFHKMQRNNN